MRFIRCKNTFKYKKPTKLYLIQKYYVNFIHVSVW